ncbi:hypothetical protein [Tomitella gaofuii]|uniref:hypothetical protein n=1 Tax=Tomitella gaofuii TaxID=2760083 RepID=UPI0015F89F5D|nr:hypothetical protein [Tomitella gaofuii]
MPETDAAVAAAPGVDVDLGMLETAVDGLREMADARAGGKSRGKQQSEGDSGDEGAVYAFSIRWGTLIFGRLERLEHYSRAGRLGQDGQRRFASLRRALHELEPAMRTFGVAVPAITLDEGRPGGGHRR